MCAFANNISHYQLLLDDKKIVILRADFTHSSFFLFTFY